MWQIPFRRWFTPWWSFLYGKIQFDCSDSTRGECVTKANTSPGPSSVSKGCKLHNSFSFSPFFKLTWKLEGEVSIPLLTQILHPSSSSPRLFPFWLWKPLWVQEQERAQLEPPRWSRNVTIGGKQQGYCDPGCCCCSLQLLLHESSISQFFLHKSPSQVGAWPRENSVSGIVWKRRFWLSAGKNVWGLGFLFAQVVLSFCLQIPNQTISLRLSSYFEGFSLKDFLKIKC